MDHIRHGKYFFNYRNPPPPPTDNEIALFNEGLDDCIAEKIARLVEYFNALDDCKNQSKLIVDKAVKDGKLNALDEYFYRLLYSCEYAETLVIQKWLRFWLKIYKRLHPDKFDTNQLVLDVAKAKETPIEDLFVGDLRHMGNRLIGLCPFHGEKTPSFTIYTDQNTYHCYGCSANGDVINFLMHKEDIGFIEAVKRLTQ